MSRLAGFTDLIECLVCHTQLRALRQSHLGKHGLTSASYRAQFPDAPLVNETLRWRGRALWEDGAEADAMHQRRRLTCKRGHRLAGRNVLVYAPRPGLTGRKCRECHSRHTSAWAKRNRPRMAAYQRTARTRRLLRVIYGDIAPQSKRETTLSAAFWQGYREFDPRVDSASVLTSGGAS